MWPVRMNVERQLFGVSMPTTGLRQGDRRLEGSLSTLSGHPDANLVSSKRTSGAAMPR